MSFQGWPPEALRFFEGLEAENTKAYWLAHKNIYERDVRGPMEELLSELTDEFGDVHLFRPYRDVRFSRDKSPYKTAIAATVGDMYVQLSSEGLRAGGGMYHMASDQLDRYREAVAADGSGGDLETIVGRLEAAAVEVYGSDALKSAPKGYSKDHPRIGLLRYRGIVAMKAWSPSPWLSTATARDRVVELFHAAAPLTAWLDANVGDSNSPDQGHRRR